MAETMTTVGGCESGRDCDDKTVATHRLYIETAVAAAAMLVVSDMGTRQVML